MESNKRKERWQLLRDAMNFKKTARAANLSNVHLWSFFDSKYSYKQIYYDWDIMRDALREFNQRYDFDSCKADMAIHAWAFTDALGGGGFILNKETGVTSYLDNKTYISADELVDYAKNPAKWDKIIFQRKYPNVTIEMMQKAMPEFLKFGQYAATQDSFYYDECQIPLIYDMKGYCAPAIETPFNALRGIKDFCLDVRRNRKQVDEFSDIYWNNTLKPNLKNYIAGCAENDNYVLDTFVSLLAHSALSYKQFEEMYWPQLKEIIDIITSAGKTIYLFVESDVLRFVDFLQEIPKGTTIMHVEMEDIFKVRQKLPDICLAGGMTTDLLGHGTPQQCVDFAKKLIDGLGEGFIMSQNKIVCYPNDCRRENLLAVNEFVRNYKLREAY